MAGPPARPPAAAVLVAAGNSLRMHARGGAEPSPRKPLLELAGRSLLEHVVSAFERCAQVVEIICVVHADDLETVAQRLERGSFETPLRLVAGGAERADSVAHGVHAITRPVELVAIHDAARAGIRTEEIERVLSAGGEHGAALLAVLVPDTLKHSDDGRTVQGTLDRTALWLAQTPQVFDRERYTALLNRALADGLRLTDDAALWERFEGPVAIVEGSGSNFKLTRPADLELMSAVLEARLREERA